jgi:hypothetical protein
VVDNAEEWWLLNRVGTGEPPCLTDATTVEIIKGKRLNVRLLMINPTLNRANLLVTALVSIAKVEKPADSVDHHC